MEIKNYYLKIADIKIYVETEFNIKVKEESINFLYKKNGSEKYNIVFKFKKIHKPLNVDGKLIHKDLVYIYKTNKGFINELYPAPGMDPYAWIIQTSRNFYEILYLTGKEHYFEYSRNIIEAIKLEQILNKFNAFILHSSFINWNNKGILFSAPSGTGKSTQADLWEKYENAEIINGDKAGIRKIDGRWMAYGLPFAGTSGIYKNKKAEISHIIVLKQGKENKLTKLSPREAFVKLYSETIVHTWDKGFQENIINMITDVVQNVQIYQYECLPDKSAVDFLKEQIIKDRGLFVENNEYNKSVK